MSPRTTALERQACRGRIAQQLKTSHSTAQRVGGCSTIVGKRPLANGQASA